MGTQEWVTTGIFGHFYSQHTIATLLVAWGKFLYSIRYLAPWHVSILAPSPLLRKPLQKASKAADVCSEVKQWMSPGHAFLMGLHWYENRVLVPGHVWGCEGGSIMELNKTLWHWSWDFLQRQCRLTLSSWRPVQNSWEQISSKSIWLMVAVLKCCRKVCILFLQFSKVITVL